MLKKAFLIFFFINITYLASAQGKINQSKKELNTGRKTYKKRDSSNSNSYDNVDEPSGFSLFIAEVFLKITYYSFIGDYGYEDQLYNNLTRYPYYNNSYGNYISSKDSITSNPQNIRLDIENSILSDFSNSYGNHFKLNFRPLKYFYLQTNYFELIEKINSNTDNISLVNLSLNYDRLKLEKFNLGWNIGVNFIANNINRLGFSYGLNTEIFFTKKISLYGTAKWSTINQRPVNYYETGLKNHLKNFFISFGFKHFKIATPTYNYIAFGFGAYF